MQTLHRLQDVQVYARAHRDARVLRERTEAGRRFLVFPDDALLRRWLLMQGDLGRYELHTVMLGDRPRSLHFDFELDIPPGARADLERFNELRDRFYESLAHYRCAVFNAVLRKHCGWRYNQEHLMVVCKSERDTSLFEQVRFSAHLVFPQVVLANNLAELRCVTEVASLARQLGASVPHDHALYRADPDKSHSLRLAGCAKYPAHIVEVLHWDTQWPHHCHDPSWVELEPEEPRMVRTLLVADKFTPCLDEQRRLPPVGPAQPRTAPTHALQQFLAKLLPQGRLRDDLDRSDWQAPDTVHFRPRPSLLALAGVRGRELGWRKVAYLFLSSQQDRSFDHFYRALEQIRPRMAVDHRARREKYQTRYQQFDRFLPHYPRPYSLAALLRALDLEQSCPQALARWRFCPFRSGECLADFQVTENRTTGRFFVECFSCGSRRQVSSRDQFQVSEFFCTRYLNEYLDDRALEPEGTTLAVNSNMGTGKTTYLAEQLARHERAWRDVLFVSVRRSLADCMIDSLHLADYRKLNKRYAEFFDSPDPKRWLVVQMESLGNLGASFRRASRTLPEVDLLVLDEYLSLCKQLQSDTMKRKHRQCWEVFTSLIRRAKRVVVLDADFVPQDVPYEFLLAHRPALGFRTLLNLHLPVPLKRVHIVDYEPWFQRARQATRTKLPLAFVSGSRTELKAVHRTLEEEAALAEPEEARASCLYSSDAAQEIMSQIPQCNELWQDLDSLGITPSVTVGVDYTGLARLVMAIASQLTCDPQTLMQMIGRFRNSTEVHMVVLNGGAMPKKQGKPPLTTDEVLEAANIKGREYLERVTEGTMTLDYETGAYRANPDDWLARMSAWCVAQRWMARRDYVGVLRAAVLSHGDVCVDERVMHELTPQRPGLVKRAIMDDALEKFRARADVLQGDEAHQQRIRQALAIPVTDITLQGPELAYLEACQPQLMLWRTWEALGGEQGARPTEEQLRDLYAADMQAHGEWVGEDHSSNPLYDLLSGDRNTGKPLPFNQFTADLVHHASLILAPFMAWAHDSWTEASFFVAEGDGYNCHEWFDEVMVPLRRPENAWLVAALRLTDTHLRGPLSSAKSLHTLLRNTLSLFEMDIDVMRQRERREGKQKTITHWMFDQSRCERVRTLLGGHPTERPLKPLFLDN